VRDLPWSELQSTVFMEIYRVKCPDRGVKVEKVPLLPTKAPFSKRFEDAVGLGLRERFGAPGGAAVRSAASTVRAIDHR